MSCPSGFDLALLASGELDSLRSHAIGAHAVPCRRCAERLHEIETARMELLGRDPHAAAVAAMRQIAAQIADRSGVDLLEPHDRADDNDA
jgi:anti-sigma factor ChrR (cupin superfamily)